MARWALLLVTLWLAACASKPVVSTGPEVLFRDRAFQPARENVSAAELFALTPAMRDYFERVIEPLQRKRGLQRGLIDALYTGGQLKLRYDDEFTRNAAEAFEARAGNCMSLVVMTAAFAKQAGMPVRFQSVEVDPSWGRRGDLYVTFGHVNVSLGRSMISASGDSLRPEWLTIDFLPSSDLRGQRVEPVEENTLVAMYMNNKAAEALAANRLDDAYWWARSAVQQDRHLLIAYNTLGVIYRRHGELDDAERVLRFALALEPRNTNVLGNLAQLLADRGRADEARVLFETLAKLQPDPPFKFFNEGVAAMGQGDFKTAKRLFEREIRRDPDYHEFHFWLALAHLQLGETAQARKQLATAAELSNSRDLQERYSAKLARLKAGSVH